MSEYKKYSRKRIFINRLSVILLLALTVALVIFAANGIKKSKINKSNNTVSNITDPPATVPPVSVTDIAPATPVDNTEPAPTGDPTDLPATDIITTDIPTDIPATGSPEEPTEPAKTQEPTANPTAKPTPTPPPKTQPPSGDYTEISIVNAGDIMFHMAQVKGAYNDSTGTYDFWPTYQYVAPYIQAADLAVVNFETTLHDTDYSGYPGFNSPVSSLQAIKDAGFDVLLYANNHCFDRGAEGVKRTLAHFREYGFQYVGATDDPDGNPDKTLIVDVNGIKIGLINYSDSVTDMNGSQYTLNDNPVSNKDWRMLNIYVTGRESEFLYDRVANDISQLKEQGADIIIAYMHWGLEYQLQPNSSQKKCAQKLCDLGVDCIIGSHPHVVQPMDVLTSSDGTRQTVCFYSLGNYVSNQNRKTLKSYDVREYTENGLMVKLIIRKYSNGYTEVARLEYVPTWVHRYLREGEKYSHEIIPLPVPESEYEAYGLTKSSFGIADSKESFKRTDDLFRDRVAAFNSGS